MNCTKTQRWMLLADSGELTPRQQARLTRHLDTCPACRAVQQNGRQILQAARDAAPAAEPSPFVLARIRAAARETRPEPRILWLRHPMVSSLACAAAVLLLLGGWFFLSPSRQTRRPEELGTILTALCDTTENEAGNANGAQESHVRWRKLANRLMEVEGLQSEHLADWQLSIIPEA